jgi:hypothetical protein
LTCHAGLELQAVTWPDKAGKLGPLVCSGRAQGKSEQFERRGCGR